MTNYKKKILNCLLDKYERSKSFTGNNKRCQRFSVKLIKLFPKYGDEAEYDLYISINEAIAELEHCKYVSLSKKKNGVIDSVTLNTYKLNEIYAFISRVPKSDTNEQLLKLITTYATKNEVLTKYCQSQIERIQSNKKAEYFDGDFEEYENILKAVLEIFNIPDETYVRDFSVKVFKDSKAFEKIKYKVTRMLFQYGNFPQEETILEDLNIVKNPGHVYIKGCGIITINGQIIDMSVLKGDIAISSVLLKNIDKIEITGSRVITIENLTTFNYFSQPDTLALYLGGYHNSHRRNFIRKIYEQNPQVSYYHYGDIDAGGFYILLHLREKTGIHFVPYQMDTDTLRQYSAYTKPLTEHDRKRLKNIVESDFSDTITYMLEHNCKLEQEALDIE
jgi:hypothetical protein